MDKFKKTIRSGILTVIMGAVSSPQAKNSRKMTTRAWYTLASPMPELWNTREKGGEVSGSRVRRGR